MITTTELEHLLAGLTRAMPVLLDGAVKSAAVLAIAWLIASRLRNSSAALRHLVWFGSLVSLLVVPLLSRSLPAWRVLPESWDVRQAVLTQRPAQAPTPGASLAIQRPADPQRQPAMMRDREPLMAAEQPGRLPDMSTLSPAVQSGPAQAAPVPAIQPTAMLARPLSPWTWVALIWLIGAALLGLRLLLGLACLLWASLRLRVCGDPDWHDALAQACSDLGIRRRVRLLLGRGRAMPMTWGIFRPHLLVPAEDGDWSLQRRRVVLLHELAHVKRWDCPTQLLAEVACAACWFDPLVWLASKRMQNEAERACDDLVLVRGSKPGEYASHLLEIAVSQHQGYLAAAMAAIPMARASKLEGRLLAILDGNRSRRALTLGVVILALALLAGVVVPVAMLRAGEQGTELKANDAAGGIARLAGGVTVEIAGVSYHPSQGRQWWGPDGATGPQYAFATRVGQIPESKQRTREFVLRIRGNLAKDDYLAHNVVSSTHTFGTGEANPLQGTMDGKLDTVSAALPASARTATVRLGLARGRWTDVAEQGPAGGVSPGNSETGSVIFGAAIDQDRDVVVTVTRQPIKDQVRIVAIGEDGQEYVGQMTGNTSSGPVAQTTARFVNLRASRVKSFRLQTRPYQWITFRNVSLEPGYRTNVQAEVGPAPDSQPAGKPDASDASQARRLSMNNMQQILRGIWICMPQKNGQWPDDLPWPQDVRQIVEKGLHKTYDESSDLLGNPQRPGTKPAYIYVRPGIPVSKLADPGKTIALYEAHEEWGAGINVGFLDGHVTFLSDEAEFKSLLDQTQAMNAASEDAATKRKPRDLPGPAKAGDAVAVGQVIRRDINSSQQGRDSFIDLDSGALLALPPELKGQNGDAIAQWARRQGVDALCEPNDDGVLSLVGLDLVAVSVSPDAWSAGPTDADRSRLAKAEPGSTFLAYQGKTHATALCRTREGAVGILQIIAGISVRVVYLTPDSGRGSLVCFVGDDIEDPKGLQIQYKVLSPPMAQSTAGLASQPTGGDAAASSQSQPSANAEETPAEGMTVTGIVTGELGHPRANVQFGQRFPSGLWKGPASDANGRFTLKGVTPDKMQWIAYSQATKRMALFTLPADASDKPILVKLNLWEGELEGRVVDANGHGVAKVKVRLSVRTPDGQRYLSDVFQSDADGYYDHDGLMPAGEGLAVEVALASRADEEDGWQCRTVLKAGQIDVAMPDLVNRDVEPKPGPAPASPRVGFGGRVVDEQGKPIAGAKVEVCYSLPGQSRGLWSRRTATDAEGRWMRHLPADMKETFMRLFHPQYVSGEQLSLPATDRMRDGSAVFVMKKGLRISGTVRSRDGGSIEDALVLANPNTATTGGLGEPIDDGTMVRTRADGSFAAECAPAGRRNLTVYAKGYGPRAVDVDVRLDMAPVNIVLEPGTKIGGQVVNPEGEPVAGARVTASDWTDGGERRAIPREAQTDAEGRFELPDMPTQGTFQLYYSKRGSEYIYTSSKGLTWQKEPYRLTLFRPTVIRGTVVDDESGKPIPQFQVTQCTRSRDDQTPSIRESQTVKAADGRFRVALDGWIVSAEGPSLAARVQAPGYLPAETQYVPIGGKIEPVTLRLVKARPIRGIVRGMDGKPLSGSMVYWVGPGRLAFIENGEINEHLVASPDATAKTDAKGVFELPASKDAGIILVLDKAGYAMRQSPDHDPDEPLRLIRWARIEGVVKAGEKGQGGVNVSFSPIEASDFRDKRPQVYFQGGQVTHTDGTFVFENVPSIPVKVGRTGSGFISHVVQLTPADGKTTRLEIGGGGAAVVGRIEKPDGLDLEAFSDGYGLGKHYTRVIAYPAEAAGVPLEQRTVYAATLQPDGQFHIYGLPAGSYVLDVSVHPPPQSGTCGVPVPMAADKASFEIKKADQKGISLPPIRLVLSRGPQPGQVAELAGKTLSGEAFDLKQLRGKVVVLDVWASWCAPCRSETPRLKQLWEKHRDDGKIVFVGINCDVQLDPARKYVAEQALPWTQVATGTWGEGNATLSSLGINAIPSFWLIGPDGVVLARDIPADSIAEQIDKALAVR